MAFTIQVPGQNPLAPFVQPEDCMNALDLLKSDHDRVDDLIDRFEAADERNAKREIFNELRGEIESHAHVEETVFYPYFESKNDEFREIVSVSLEDHQEMRELIEEVQDALEQGSADQLEDSFDELASAIQGHVDEEETELFSMVEQECSSSELERLGDEMDQARESFMPPKAA